MVSGSDFFENDGYKKAVQRVEAIVECDSFSQLEAYVPDSNVVTGFALADNRVCYLYSQYGPVTAAHANKVAHIYEKAVAAGAPVIGILDSSGLDISEGMETLAAYGKIFKAMSDANGVIPQYSVVCGGALGIASVICGLSDFTFAVKDAKMFIQSANTVDDAKTVGLDKLFGAKYHSGESGAVQFLFDDEESLTAGIKKFLSFMPQNNLEDTPVTVSNEEVKDVSYLETLKGASELDVYKVIEAICDEAEFIEASKDFGKDVITCFARIDGFSVGLVANNGKLSDAGIRKLVKTVSFCDAFNMPLVALTDVSAFEANVSNQKYIIANAASLAYVFANATVPKINIILKNANGTPSMLFNSKFIGADLVYAWPDANSSLFEPEAAKAVLHQEFKGLDSALSSGYIDGVMEPEKTRKAIVTAIENLLTKRVFKHPKKHGTMCF